LGRGKDKDKDDDDELDGEALRRKLVEEVLRGKMVGNGRSTDEADDADDADGHKAKDGSAGTESE
jgi:hypothetical protein